MASTILALLSIFGIKFLFQVSLALTGKVKNKLLQMNEEEALFFLKDFAKEDPDLNNQEDYLTNS